MRTRTRQTTNAVASHLPDTEGTSPSSSLDENSVPSTTADQNGTTTDKKTLPKRVMKTVGVLVSLAIIALAATHSLSLWQINTVLTGSMRPGIQPGDLAVTTTASTSSLRRGQILLYNPPGYSKTPLSHRIVNLKKTAKGTVVTTKGDANNTADAPVLLTKRSAWVVRFHIPKVGYAINWLQQPIQKLILFIIAIIFVLGTLWSFIWDGTKEKDEEEDRKKLEEKQRRNARPPLTPEWPVVEATQTKVVQKPAAQPCPPDMDAAIKSLRVLVTEPSAQPDSQAPLS